MKKNSYDVAIVGGGVIGCALARELGKRFARVILIEKEREVGCHTSGRNSGVVHSGFNPKPGTLKARLCVEGSRLTREFCKERSVPCEQVGTYVLAMNETELPLLYELKSRGEKNGVPGLEILPIDQVRQREPNVNGIAALFSPTGAIVDSRELTRALARDAQELNVVMALGEPVIKAEEKPNGVQLSTKNGNYTAQLMVNCAGLHADRLAHLIGVGRDYGMVPFRGEYYVVPTTERPIIHSMVYPVPHPLLPFLGIHLTRTTDRSVLIGPNAVPAFGREAYSRWAINLRDLRQMMAHRGIWNALIRNRVLLKVALNELRNSCSKRHFLKEASRLVSGLRPSDLTLGRRAGIRPQLIRANGQLLDDLVIESTARSIHIMNVVSPGMTSALAFARWFSDGINETLRWTRCTGETAGSVN